MGFSYGATVAEQVHLTKKVKNAIKYKKGVTKYSECEITFKKRKA